MKKNNDETFEKISSCHLNFLRFLALIPFEGRQLQFIGTRILSVYFHLVSVLYCSMWIGYGARMLARKKWEVDFICELLTVLATSLRYLLFYIQRKKLIFLVSLCKELWSHVTIDEIVTVKFFERKAYYFRNFLLCNSVGVATIFILSTQFLNVSSSTFNQTERKNLPFRFFMNVQEEPTFTIVKSFQIILVYSMTILIPGTETAGLFLIMMACGYLKSVQNRLLSLTKQNKISFKQNSEIEKKMVEICVFHKTVACAKFHQQIMVFCEEVERFTCNIFFIMVFASVYNMSIAGLAILKNDEHRYNIAGVFVMNMFQFFTYQWSPEILLVESDAIRNAAYFASFQQCEQDNKINKILFFIMLRAHKPVHLTAGGYVKLSMETFAVMLKSSFSFFTLMQNF